MYKPLAILGLSIFLGAAVIPGEITNGPTSPSRLLEDSITTVGRITTERERGEGFGSCVPIKIFRDKDNYRIYFLTANHTVDGAKSIKIDLFNKGAVISKDPTLTLTDVKVYYSSKARDLAIIICSSKVYVKVSKLSKSPPEFMKQVVCVGCPIGLPPIITEGRVNRLASNTKGFDRWIVTAQAIPGNSGGGVYDKETGELIGITSAVASFPNGFVRVLVFHIQYVAPTNEIFNLVKNLK